MDKAVLEEEGVVLPQQGRRRRRKLEPRVDGKGGGDSLRWDYTITSALMSIFLSFVSGILTLRAPTVKPPIVDPLRFKIRIQGPK